MKDVNFNILFAEKILIRYLGNLEHPSARVLLAAQKKDKIDFWKIVVSKYNSAWDNGK
jgi:hypothetical protein